MCQGDSRLLLKDSVNFCYGDESGTGDQPIATMVGIVVDSGRMHLTKSDWAELLDLLSEMADRKIVEFHTADFYAGNGVWRGIDGSMRSSVITAILDWLADRKHHVVYTSVNKQSYFEALKAEELPDELNTIWRFLGFHLTLAIQRYSQPEKGTKGNTVLVFDKQDKEEERFINLVQNPPEWSDEYYGRGEKQDQLDQIIDVPYFGDSKHYPLIQVADCLSFFLRRYAEIREGLVPAAYHDEEEKVSRWVEQLAQRSIGRAHIYPRVQRNEAHNYFYRHAAPCIRNL